MDISSKSHSSAETRAKRKKSNFIFCVFYGKYCDELKMPKKLSEASKNLLKMEKDVVWRLGQCRFFESLGKELHRRPKG